MRQAIAVLADAGFDVVHPFDPAVAAGEPGLELLADPARRLGFVVGNTRALWPRFVAARRADPELAAAADPLDRYTERAIVVPGARVWFGHRKYEAGFVPLQRLAAVTGLAALAPSRLSIHPVYGPWFALRAVLVVDGEPPPTGPTPAPCSCDAACHDARARADLATGPDAWRAWLAVRDACPVGRAYRYGEDQLAYHYTKDRRLLD